jgi:predicted RNase H-like nuclease
MSDPRVLGVDACKAGWVGVLVHGGRVAAYVAAGIAELVADAGDLDAVAVDMPIGLPDDGRRRADELAWRALGPRRASIFMTPVRAALADPDYAAASAENARLTGSGISRQAFGLRPKLLQVDEWVRRTRRRVVEAHPELSFAELAGAPLATRKLTWAGAQARRRLLAEAGIRLPDDLGEAGERAAVDDVLDAAAVAWTARRVASGRARCVPDPPQTFSDGLAAAIWI